MGMDKGIGKYTYVGSTGSSVVDYVLISESITDTISKFRVGEPNILSDHCAVYFSLSSAIQNLQASETNTQPSEQVNKKFVWKLEETQNYRDTFTLYEEDFLLLQTHLGRATSEQDINENVDRFSKLMSNICDPFFAKAVKPNNYDNITSNNTNKQPWFDEECTEKRQIFYKALGNFRANKNALNQRNLSEAQKIFKNVIRRKRYAFDKSKTE